MLIFLDNHAPAIRSKRATYWINLADELGEIITGSKAKITTKAWREKRSNDDWVSTGTFIDCRGDRHFPRSTKRLNIRLQNYLFRELLSSKRGKDKPLHITTPSNLEKKFKDVYNLTIEEVNIPHMKGHSYRHPPCLFSQMYDIPYQSSIMRSIDILHENNTLPTTLFSKMHWDMELGRGLFAVALEFHMREAESTEHRLSLCINQLSYLYRNMEDLVFKGKIKDWLQHDDIEFIDHTKKIQQQEAFLTQDKVSDLKDKIERLSATKINACFSIFEPVNNSV